MRKLHSDTREDFTRVQTATDKDGGSMLPLAVKLYSFAETGEILLTAKKSVRIKATYNLLTQVH